MRFIDADALAEYEENAWDWETVDYIQTTTAINQIISDIRNESTADVRENVHGEWIRHTRVEDVYDIKGIKTWGIKHQCNRCTFTTIAIEDFGYYQFCPNCGADMRGETMKIQDAIKELQNITDKKGGIDYGTRTETEIEKLDMAMDMAIMGLKALEKIIANVMNDAKDILPYELDDDDIEFIQVMFLRKEAKR